MNLEQIGRQEFASAYTYINNNEYSPLCPLHWVRASSHNDGVYFTPCLGIDEQTEKFSIAHQENVR